MEVCTVGGYEGVGKNMTAVKVNDDVFIFDMGLDIPAMIKLQDENIPIYSEKQLRRAGAIPDDIKLDKLGWRKKVRAIIIGHAHLDHVGAVPWLAHRYPNAKILATPFTMEILKTIAKDERKKLKNKLVPLNPDSSYHIKGKKQKYKLDFVHITHSTLQAVSLALHTKEGIFYYAVDFKFDNTPVMGKKPNYQKIKQLGKKGIKVLVTESLYSAHEGKTPTEMKARKLIQEKMSELKNSKTALFVTTFASHISRLKSIVDFGKKTNRKIIFLGRSMHKYITAAMKINRWSHKNVEIVKYRRQANAVLRKVQQNRDKYLIVCTGHQAEEGSILDRITRNETPFKFKKGDNLIFASRIIPVALNILAREKMDQKLRKSEVNLHEGLHVSGHAFQDNLKELIGMLHPKHIIPTHGTHEQELPLVRVAQKLGYEFPENVNLSKDGKVLKF